MRTLTSIQSATSVRTDLNFFLKAADQSTSWAFNGGDIKSVSPLDWEVPFAGGLGRPSNYSISISTSAGFIKSNFRNLIKGEGFLKVFVNSDNFTPHAGVIRGLHQDNMNPDIINFQIYDKSLDRLPNFPSDLITDSYYTTHPEVINNSVGYPVYYGKHTRPIYMTPVNCDLTSLIGPRNVSSENHVIDFVFTSAVAKGFDTTLEETTIVNKTWAQQSDDDNLLGGGYPFEVLDVANNTKLFKINDGAAPITYQSCLCLYAVESPLCTWNYVTGGQFKYTIPGVANRLYSSFTIEKNYDNINYTTRLNYAVSKTRDGGIIGGHNKFFFLGRVSSGSGRIETLINCLGAIDATSHTLAGSFTAADSYSFLLKDTAELYLGVRNAGGGDWFNGYVGSLFMGASLKSEAYNMYSIAGMPVNCSDIAFSENPIQIIENIFEASSLSPNTTKFAGSTSDTALFKFQCYFDKPVDVKKIADEFGQTTGNYFWISDSGFISSRTYQDSVTATNCIDYTITTTDVIMDTMIIKTNPLGTTVYETQKAYRFEINYGYDIALGSYSKFLVADAANNSYCDSANVAGIAQNINFSSKYILESDTASLCLSNLVKKATQDEIIVEASLPARYFGMELADVVKIQSPTLLNSESLFQVTRIRHDYMNGTVQIKANEIINGTGF